MQPQTNEAGKVKKQFDQALKSLLGILKKENENEILPSKRVSRGVLDDVVETMLRKQEEKNAIEVQQKLESILENYAALKKAVAEKQKELLVLEESKMKEFTKAVTDLFTRVESFNEQKALMVQGLEEATTENEEDPK